MRGNADSLNMRTGFETVDRKPGGSRKTCEIEDELPWTASGASVSHWVRAGPHTALPAIGATFEVDCAVVMLSLRSASESSLFSAERRHSWRRAHRCSIAAACAAVGEARARRIIDHRLFESETEYK